MNTYVTYNDDHKVLICKQHQCAVSLKYLSRHLLDSHNLSLKERQDILAYASQFIIVEPKELTYSINSVNPIPYLRIIQAYRCEYESCNVICGTLDTVKEHCKRKHIWKIKDGVRWLNISAQTFYQGNDRRYIVNYWFTYSRYFAVHEPDVLPVTNFTEQLLEGLLNQARRRDEQHQEQINRVLDNTSLVTKTPWLRYNK